MYKFIGFRLLPKAAIDKIKNRARAKHPPDPDVTCGSTVLLNPDPIKPFYLADSDLQTTSYHHTLQAVALASVLLTGPSLFSGIGQFLDHVLALSSVHVRV